MLYCEHKPLGPFFTIGMSSPVYDKWALELQQFAIKFQHIQGKKIVVANAVSRLRMLGLCQDNGNEDVPPTVGEVHSTDVAQATRPVYNMGKTELRCA